MPQAWTQWTQVPQIKGACNEVNKKLSSCNIQWNDKPLRKEIINRYRHCVEQI